MESVVGQRDDAVTVSRLAEVGDGLAGNLGERNNNFSVVFQGGVPTQLWLRVHLAGLHHREHGSQLWFYLEGTILTKAK